MAKWDRRTGESAKAFRAFCIYRDLGVDRTIEKALAEHLKTGEKGQLSTWKKWSAGFDWVERAGSWDEHLDRKARRELEKERRDSLKRHEQAGKALFALGLKALGKKKPEELTPKDIETFVSAGIRIERQALGEPSEIVDFRETASRRAKAAKVKRFLQRHVGVSVDETDDSSDGADASDSG